MTHNAGSQVGMWQMLNHMVMWEVHNEDMKLVAWLLELTVLTMVDYLEQWRVDLGLVRLIDF